jgi:pyruvate ferredoxin oxidoreductase gamma subunit
MRFKNTEHADSRIYVMVGTRFHGRDGQGAVVASKILVNADFKQGLFVPASPSFGMERKGATASTFARLDSIPIVERGEIRNPASVIVLDSSVLYRADLVQGAKTGALIPLNCSGDERPISAEGPVEWLAWMHPE